MYIYTVCTFSPRGVTFWAFHFSTGGFLSHLFVGGQRLTSISTRELHCTCGLARRLMEGLNSRFPSNLFRMRREVQPPVKLHRALKVTWSFPQVQPLGLEKPTLRDLLCRHLHEDIALLAANAIRKVAIKKVVFEPPRFPKILVVVGCENLLHGMVIADSVGSEHELNQYDIFFWIADILSKFFFGSPKRSFQRSFR